MSRRILDASLGELRRRRWDRRGRTSALLAALAAAALLFAVVPPPAGERPAPQGVEERKAEAVSAVDLEWGALDRPDEAKRLYRQAGERYAEEGDLAGAVRSYGGSLDAGTAEDLETTPDDDWLLMAIKLARKKESGR